MNNITIIDYGIGNIGSLVNMFKKIEVQSHIATNKSDVKKAEKIILPGVGSFDHAMISLNKSGMRDELDHMVLDLKIPTLGICLGAQMLGHTSEEGQEKGLCWVPMITKRFQEKSLRIPHMGWNIVHPQKKHLIFSSIDEEMRFYFVHSYFMHPFTDDIILAKSIYGQPFSSMVYSDNIVGAQFHPEKSHRFGLSLLKNFTQLC